MRVPSLSARHVARRTFMSLIRLSQASTPSIRPDLASAPQQGSLDRNRSHTVVKIDFRREINWLSDLAASEPCVIFVQHPHRFRLFGFVRARSDVACALAIDHVDRATEGGIPRSSRLGLSLKSLAFMRVCPKARRDFSGGFRGIGELADRSVTFPREHNLEV